MHDANNAVRMKEIISFSVRVGLAKGPQPATHSLSLTLLLRFPTFVDAVCVCFAGEIYFKINGSRQFSINSTEPVGLAGRER